VSIEGSCSTPYHTNYTNQYELLVVGEPTCVVAVGRQVERGQTIHGASLLAQNSHVTIDEVRDPHARVLVPTSEIQFMGEALDTFIFWPQTLIMPYFDPPHVL